MVRAALTPVALISLIFYDPALAQSYPAKPIRIVVGFTAGSTTDVLTRTVGQKLVETCPAFWWCRRRWA